MKSFTAFFIVAIAAAFSIIMVQGFGTYPIVIGIYNKEGYNTGYNTGYKPDYNTGYKPGSNTGYKPSPNTGNRPTCQAYSSQVCGEIQGDCIKFACQEDLDYYNDIYRTYVRPVNMISCTYTQVYQKTRCYTANPNPNPNPNPYPNPNPNDSTYCPSTNKTVCAADTSLQPPQCIGFRCGSDITKYNSFYGTKFQQVADSYCTSKNITEGQLNYC